MMYLRTCKPVECDDRDNPAAWMVPNKILRIHKVYPMPIANVRIATKAQAKHRRFREMVNKAYKSLYAADEIGPLPRSSLARAYRSGQIDPDLGELIVFKNKSQHDFTNYDELLKLGFTREEARIYRCEKQPRPQNWKEYLEPYGFDDPVSLALSGIILTPTRCHPVFFCELKIAVRRAGLDLVSLTRGSVEETLQT
jgi:hypothetical protein